MWEETETKVKLRQGNTAFRDKRIYKSKRSAKRENRAVSVIPAEGNQEAATELSRNSDTSPEDALRTWNLTLN